MIVVLIAHFWKAYVFWINKNKHLEIKSEILSADSWLILNNVSKFYELPVLFGDLPRLPVVMLHTHLPGRWQSGYRLSTQEPQNHNAKSYQQKGRFF